MEQEIFLEEEDKENLEHLRQENFEIVSEVDIDVNKVDNVATVSIKRWDGSTKSVDIYDGERGPEGPVGPAGRDGVDGKDAKINGENTLSIVAGENITIDQEGSTLTISAEEGTIDYRDLENKPTINNVELSGNKSSSDLGLQPAGNYLTEETDPVFSASASAEITSEDIISWNNKSDFSGDYNDLENKPTIPVVPTNVSAFNNDAGYTTNTGTITSVKMNGSTISSSGEADLGTVITDISGKQDTLVSGTNIKTINNESILGSGDITISSGSGLEARPMITTILLAPYDFDDSSNIGIYYDNGIGQQPFVYLTGSGTTKANYTYIRLVSFIHNKKLSEASSNEEIGAMVYENNGEIKISTFTKNSSGEITRADNSIGTTLTSSAQTISGVKTFSSLPVCSTAPSGNNDLSNKKYVDDSVSGKQDTLVSGTNIKTINNTSILGSGNIDISGGSSTDVQVNGTSIVSNNVANIITNTAYNSSTNKIATMSDINNAITVALTTSY